MWGSSTGILYGHVFSRLIFCCSVVPLEPHQSSLISDWRFIPLLSIYYRHHRLVIGSIWKFSCHIKTRGTFHTEYHWYYSFSTYARQLSVCVSDLEQYATGLILFPCRWSKRILFHKGLHPQTGPFLCFNRRNSKLGLQPGFFWLSSNLFSVILPKPKQFSSSTGRSRVLESSDNVGLISEENWLSLRIF